MLLRSDIEEFCMALERDGCPRAAATLQHFYTLFREREEQSAIIGRLRDALQLVTRTGCGCHPKCQCEEPGSLAIWKEEAVDAARSALEACGLAKDVGHE